MLECDQDKVLGLIRGSLVLELAKDGKRVYEVNLSLVVAFSLLKDWLRKTSQDLLSGKV